MKETVRSTDTARFGLARSEGIASGSTPAIQYRAAGQQLCDLRLLVGIDDRTIFLMWPSFAHVLHGIVIIALIYDLAFGGVE